MFGLGSVAYWIEKTIGSVAYVKTIAPQKWRHNDFRGGRDLSQNVRGSLTNPWIPSVTLYISVLSDVMVDDSFLRQNLADAGFTETVLKIKILFAQSRCQVHNSYHYYKREMARCDSQVL